MKKYNKMNCANITARTEIIDLELVGKYAILGDEDAALN